MDKNKRRRSKKRTDEKENSIALAILLFSIVIVVVGAILGVCCMVTVYTQDKMVRLGVWAGGIFLAYYIATSIQVVGAKEVALLIFAGITVGLRKSGPCFAPKWFTHLERFPTDIFELDIKDGTVVTMKGSDGDEILEQDHSVYDATVYFSFPRFSQRRLTQALKANVPRKPDELKAWVDTAVNSAIGKVGSTMTYRDFTTKREQVEKKASDHLDKRLFGAAGFNIVPSSSTKANQTGQKQTTAKKKKTKGKGKMVPRPAQEAGVIFLMLERTEPSKKLMGAIQQVNIEMLQRESSLADAEEVATKSGGAYGIGIQQALHISPEEAAAKIMQDPELKSAMVEVIDRSIGDHFAGTEGKLVRVTRNSGTRGGCAGGGNQLADAIVEAIATLDGMKNGAYRDRLRRILGMDEDTPEDGAPGAKNRQAWIKGHLGVDAEDILNDEEEVELEAEAEVA